MAWHGMALPFYGTSAKGPSVAAPRFCGSSVSITPTPSNGHWVYRDLSPHRRLEKITQSTAMASRSKETLDGIVWILVVFRDHIGYTKYNLLTLLVLRIFYE